MNRLSLSFLACLFLCILFLFKIYGNKSWNNSVWYFEVPLPIENHQINEVYRVAKLLEKCKTNTYPISKQEGREWSNLLEVLSEKELTCFSENNQEVKSIFFFQYQSDGANYKLVNFSRSNCSEIYEAYPKLVVTIKNECIGYGIWTKRAQWTSLPFNQP